MAETCEAAAKDKSLTRLPVDRIFTVAGHGTVVTGTLVEGTVEKGDVLVLHPSMKETNVRAIQVHSKEVDAAYGGQRVALNLTLKKMPSKSATCWHRKAPSPSPSRWTWR